ncbi:MAG: AzlD domain-containing protein [Proteobacteria bacterium]|nr:AzlD domain-containing protein [Pseudomonadota bacterium]
MSEYTLLAIACGLGTYVWRGLGVAVSARVRPESELFAWIGCVAFAMLAGLISRVVLIPSGALEHTALWQRLAATGFALAAYFLFTKKNLFAGVIASAAAMYLILLLS